MSAKLLRRPEVLARLGISTATLYDWMDASSQGYKPEFPRPLALSHDRIGRATVVAWREADIDAWVSSLGNASASNAAGVAA